MLTIIYLQEYYMVSYLPLWQCPRKGAFLNYCQLLLITMPEGERVRISIKGEHEYAGS